jgi:hypothetical protein
MVPTPRAFKSTLLLLVTVFALGCTGANGPNDKANDTDQWGNNPDTGRIPLSLIEFDRWTLLDPERDPSPEHRSPESSCDPGGAIPEEGVFEVNTNDCGYAVLGQPTMHSIAAGDSLELLMYHSALSAIDEPAEGHFSLWIGDTLFWELNVDIPAAAEIYFVPVTVDFDADEGTEVRVHLHNHGGNSWRIAHLKRLP